MLLDGQVFNTLQLDWLRNLYEVLRMKSVKCSSWEDGRRMKNEINHSTLCWRMKMANY